LTFTLANLIRGHASERPDRVALVGGDRRVTYAQLHERSSRCAGALRAAGVGPGDRVAALTRNTTEYFDALFGASKLDAVLVGLNWRLAAPELAAILGDAAPKVLIADPDYAALVPPEAERPESMRVVVLGDEFEQWLADAPADDPEAESGPDSAVLILYSSGTTGVPKGITLTNRNMSYSGRMVEELFRMPGDCVHLVVSPLFHIGGIGTGLTSVRAGGTTVLLADASPESILDTIEREQVTHAFFVPAVIQRIVELAVAGDRDVSSLQIVSYGAAPMTEALLRRALEVLRCGFVHCYGMTETAGTVIALPPEEHVPDGDRTHLLRSIGRSLSWLEVRVTDLATNEEAAPGDVGEIWVRSEQSTEGYWNQPAATEATIVDGGWLRTGDGAYRDEEGYFFLKDRIKDMIISGGENIYPAEVENALADHPAVDDVAVIGVPHVKWGETPKAVVVLRSGQDATAAELIEFTRTQLARYKCPTSVEFVPELPRNPTGKVLKKVLREQYAETSH
jgi:long-chain acyl-CoA synthetase